MKRISVLNISSGDLVGSRFNGFDWHQELEDRNFDSKMLIGWNKDSTNNWTHSIINNQSRKDSKSIAKAFYRTALNFGNEHLNYPWTKKVFDHPWYRDADIIHLQIVHDGTLDFASIKRICQEKPTVWTWHDPWPLTGHCVYPMDCPRWNQGCGSCPDLLRPFTIKIDNTREMRKRKRELVSENYSLHVATDWFANLIKSDRTIETPSIHVIPFGIQTEWAGPRNSQKARERFQIPEDHLVLGVRSTSEPQKNLDLVKNALRYFDCQQKITLLTIQNLDEFKFLEGIINVVEIPWSNEDEIISSWYSAQDLFLMPSTWETFGFMALEAMSYQVPVVGLANTATDEVCQLRNNGIALNSNSPYELFQVISWAQENKARLRQLGIQSSKFVSENRKQTAFLDSLVNLYLEEIKRRK